MDAFFLELNKILVDVYHNILRVEELALRQVIRANLTISEMHMIECVGKGKANGRSISELAEDLNITNPSATVSVNKLAKKGFVQKVTSENDRRVVQVYLTREGTRIDTLHRLYHRNMVKAISDGLTEEEKDILMRSIHKLNGYFIKSIGENI